MLGVSAGRGRHRCANPLLRVEGARRNPVLTIVNRGDPALRECYLPNDGRKVLGRGDETKGIGNRALCVSDWDSNDKDQLVGRPAKEWVTDIGLVKWTPGVGPRRAIL